MREVVKSSSNNHKNMNNRQRSPQISTRRKRKKKNYALYYLMALILIVVAFVGLSLTVFFNISKITISGSSIYSQQEIIDAAGIKIGDNLFRKNISVLEKNVMSKLTNIDYIKISRSLPSELLIEIKPSVPAANIEYDGQYCTISENGRVIADKLTSPDENLILIKGFDAQSCNINTSIKSTDPHKDEIIKIIFDTLDSLSFKDITQIDISDRLNISLTYKNKVEIEIGSSLDLKYKITFAKTIIDGNISDDFEGKIIMHGDSGVSVIKKEDLEDLTQ